MDCNKANVTMAAIAPTTKRTTSFGVGRARVRQNQNTDAATIGSSRRSPRRSKAPIQKLTVAAHREHIRDKLRLSDSTSLMRYAVRWVEARDTGTAR
jgi:hypothetical protein